MNVGVRTAFAVILLLQRTGAIFLDDALWSEHRSSAEALCVQPNVEFEEEEMREDFQHAMYRRQARFIATDHTESRLPVGFALDALLPAPIPTSFCSDASASSEDYHLTRQLD